MQLARFLETPNRLDWKLSSSAMGFRWLEKEGMNYRKRHTLNGDSSLDLSSSLLIFACVCVWRPEVDIRCLHLLLWAESLLSLEFTESASLPSLLAWLPHECPAFPLLRMGQLHTCLL